ncbi:MAG: triose-phosphate isomerase [Deltaproteobacteria bacterium]|nr:triose-phosphate isomerase [Deltaproteobacteria bacterium]
MPRRPLIAGNWKLHKTVAEALTLVRELKRLLAPVRHCDLVVAPTYTALHPVARALADSNLSVAAQDLYYADQGAFTGAVSGPLVYEAGCRYVIVAHSERRLLFGETLDSSVKRLGAALRAKLIPIFCVGETLAEREAGRTADVVAAQLDAGTRELDADTAARLVIAYEPVWAIGTGKVATPEQAQAVHAMIRERLRQHKGAVAESVRILYGGSVKPDNAGDLLRRPDIDGALVGGASLDAASFAAIAKAAAPA